MTSPLATQGKWWREAVPYQIYPRSFFDARIKVDLNSDEAPVVPPASEIILASSGSPDVSNGELDLKKCSAIWFT